MSAQTPQKYKVAIKCLVYNHEPYLRECLEGFVMQQTDFPFVAIVHDDASTDHSADIIREYAAKYPDIIHPIYETENQWRKADGSLRKIMNDAIEATGAPYIALCEGDDYWTDPHKLQKQVDFLDANPDYSLCFHKVNIESDFYKEQKLFSHLEERAYSAREIYERWTIPTCSVMYRYLSAVHRKCVSPMVYGDIHLFLSLAQKGRIYCLACVGATYRRHEGSITQHMSSKTIIALLQQYKSMETIFPNLIDITKQYERVYLDRLFYFQKEVKDVWKYRLWYCRLNPKLFMHPFFVITIYKYMLLPYIRKVFK